MSKEAKYPLFVPPTSVNSKKPREWSYDEAKVYFEWLMKVKDDRVDFLRSFLDETNRSYSEQDLGIIGKKVCSKLLSEPFSAVDGSKRVLTNEGYALAADISLLLAEFILAKYPFLKWGIVQKPKKDLSFHLPALMPYPKYGHLELMRITTINAKNIITGEETCDIWLEIFHSVSERLKET